MKFFEERQALWERNIPLAEAVNQTKVLVSEIEHLDETLSKNKESLATKKDKDKKQLIVVLFEMVSILSAYASKSGDDTLKDHIGYPLSKLQTMRDAALVSVASGVLTKVTEKAEALTTFNVSASKLNSLSAAISDYKDSLATMRTSTSTRKRSNEKIAELLANALKITREQTDKLMVSYMNTNMDFYKTYLSTRKIVQYGTRYNKDDENPDSEGKEPEK
jgi:hypothetical protein